MDFIDKKGKGKYVIEEDEEALIEISKIFSSRILTEEIGNYLKEIIINDETTDKSELCSRFEKFLPFCLDQQFYIKTIEFPKNIIHGAFANFYGYWFIMSHLEQKKNLIHPSSKEKFIYLLKLLEGKKTPINLSYQNLNSCNLSGVDFDGANLSFGDFSNCNMNNCLLISANLENTNFEQSIMELVNFGGAILIKTNFNSTRLGLSNIQHNELVNCEFNSAFCFGTNFFMTNFKGSTFDNCQIGNAIFKDARGLKAKFFLNSHGYTNVLDFDNKFVQEINKLKKEAGLDIES